jgi:glycerol-3-phosphate acyltransferase PlsX
VAIDAMGGDAAPDVTVAGAILAARELGVPIWLVGHEDVLRAKVAAQDAGDLPLTIHHAPDVIHMNEAPVAAVRRKPRCSLRVAFDLLRDDRVDAVVSAGNSGAVMAAGLFVLGPLGGIERPAIAVPIPTTRGHVILLDAGASVSADARQLVQFAVMGEVYARVLSGAIRPRIGMLSNGQEESKGTEATRAASAVLRESSLNFVGYVEGRDVCSGAADVVVCDGFVGNAVLKALEGCVALTVALLGDAFRRSWRTRLGYRLARPALDEMRGRLDYAAHGGAPLLGLGGIAIVAHGSSGPRAIANAIRVAYDSVRLDVNRHIADGLAGMAGALGDATAPRSRRLWTQLKDRLARRRDGGAPPPRTGPGADVPPDGED